MKLTTNYIVYLNADNKVECAKCRITGRYVKRALAQNEYENEYNYSSVSILTMFILFATSYLANLLEDLTMTSLTIAEVMTAFNAGKQIVLFTSINTHVYKLGVTSEVEILVALNSGEVEKGRIV